MVLTRRSTSSTTVQAVGGAEPGPSRARERTRKRRKVKDEEESGVFEEAVVEETSFWPQKYRKFEGRRIDEVGGNRFDIYRRVVSR
jgi:hypothetical protein